MQLHVVIRSIQYELPNCQPRWWYVDIFRCKLAVSFRESGWVFPKIMVPPNHPFVHKVFHDFHHPFWGVFSTIFGNIQLLTPKKFIQLLQVNESATSPTSPHHPQCHPWNSLLAPAVGNPKLWQRQPRKVGKIHGVSHNSSYRG